MVVGSDRYSALEGIPDPDVAIGGQSDVILGWSEIAPEVGRRRSQLAQSVRAPSIELTAIANSP